MPKKQKIKTDEIRDGEKAPTVLGMIREGVACEQSREGGYWLGAPQLHTTDDGIVAVVQSTAYTVHGESPITTTVTFSAGQSRDMPTVKDIVRRAIEDARSDAEAVIEAVEEEWDANVGEFDDAEGDDADEGLREGPVVGSGSGAYFAKGNAVCEAADARVRPGVYFAKGNDFPDDDGIRIPNGEYADLVAAARREADLRDAFGNGLVTASNGGDGEKPYLKVEFPTLKAALRAQGMLLCGLDNHAFERPVPADGEAPAGEIDIPEFVAATTGSTASDATLNDGGPVEPELDIDALVAAADVQRDTCALDIRAVRSAEYPHLTVTVTGPGSAELVGRIISDIHLPSLTEPLVVARPVEGDVGEFATTKVDPVADAEAFRRVVRARF